MPNDTAPRTGWTPSPWTPGGWQPNPNNPYFNPQPLPPMNYQRTPRMLSEIISAPPGSPGTGPNDVAGIVGTPGGPGAQFDPVGFLPNTGPNLGGLNLTMPGMHSPTGVGMPPVFPSARDILNDKLLNTMGP